MASRCVCGAFIATPSQTVRQVRCASCGASWKVPAGKAARSAAGRQAALARASGQTPEQRQAIARKAAQARWAKVPVD
jgi:hypothetical protein